MYQIYDMSLSNGNITKKFFNNSELLDIIKLEDLI